MKDEQPPLMNGDQYRYAIEALGLSQANAAKFLGVNYTTQARWLTSRSPIPDATAMLLTLMIERQETPENVTALVTNPKSVVPSARR